MKTLNLILLSLIVLCFTFNSSFAQKKSHAQEMLADFSKIKNGYELMEKGLLPIAQSHMKGFTVQEVKINRKTGMIELIGKGKNGGLETLSDIGSSTYYDKTGSGGNQGNSYFKSWWDWLFGTSAPAPTEEDEHQGDPLPDNFGKKPNPEDVMQHG